MYFDLPTFTFVVPVFAPIEQFISSTDPLHLSCPLYHPLLHTVWFRNGAQIADSMEQNLTRASTDLNSLYGVYQCYVGLSGDQPLIGGRGLFTVARVMPYGM